MCHELERADISTFCKPTQKHTALGANTCPTQRRVQFVYHITIIWRKKRATEVDVTLAGHSTGKYPIQSAAVAAAASVVILLCHCDLKITRRWG